MGDQLVRPLEEQQHRGQREHVRGALREQATAQHDRERESAERARARAGAQPEQQTGPLLGERIHVGRHRDLEQQDRQDRAHGIHEDPLGLEHGGEALP